MTWWNLVEPDGSWWNSWWKSVAKPLIHLFECCVSLFLSTFKTVDILIFEYFVFPQFQGSLRNLLGSSLTNLMAPEITRGIRCCYDADASQMQRKGSDFDGFCRFFASDFVFS